jgi:hypothetical protein
MAVSENHGLARVIASGKQSIIWRHSLHRTADQDDVDPILARRGGCHLGTCGRHPTDTVAFFTVHHLSEVTIKPSYVSGCTWEAVVTGASCLFGAVWPY